MDKQRIERITVEEVENVPFIEPSEDEGIGTFSDTQLSDLVMRCLARIDAERGKEAVAWMHSTDSRAVTRSLGGMMDTSGWNPLFLSPTPIPEGMVLVSKRLLTDHDYKWLPEDMALVPTYPTSEMQAKGRVWMHRNPEDVWRSMLAAAQGEK